MMLEVKFGGKGYKKKNTAFSELELSGQSNRGGSCTERSKRPQRGSLQAGTEHRPMTAGRLLKPRERISRKQSSHKTGNSSQSCQSEWKNVITWNIRQSTQKGNILENWQS